MRPITLRAALTLAAMSLPVLALAQTPVAPGEERTAAALPHRSPDDPAALNDVNLNIIDHKLALSMAVDTWMQVEANQWALESLRSESAKQLIAARIESQRAFGERLELLTDGRCGDAIAEAAHAIRRDAEGTQTRAVRFRPLALQRHATAMMVRIRLEILQEYTQAVQAQLPVGAADFDQQFLRADILHQLQMLAMLDVFANQASADFAQVIEQQRAVALEHLSLSRQTLAQLEAQPLAASAVELPAQVSAAP